jgi:hypothetical protein
VGQYLLAPADRLSANCRGCVKTAPVTNRSRPPGQLANMMHEAAPIGEERVQGDPRGPGGPPCFCRQTHLPQCAAMLRIEIHPVALQFGKSIERPEGVPLLHDRLVIDLEDGRIVGHRLHQFVQFVIAPRDIR